MARRFDQSSDGGEVDLAAGEEFEIALAENPTTGFRWRFVADGSPACALLSDDFRAPAEGRPGQGGQRVLKFRAGRAGEGEVRLVSARAGSSAQGARGAFTLRVRVRGQ